MQPISRRDFLKRSSSATATLAVSGTLLRAAKSPNEKVIVGVIGCNGRGMAHIAGFQNVPNTEIAYVCDVDSRALTKAAAAVAKKQPKPPNAVKDLRRILEDPAVDAVSIATPDHWHAPAAILACSAGKHVYVEKPASHNFQESQFIVEAARKH